MSVNLPPWKRRDIKPMQEANRLRGQRERKAKSRANLRKAKLPLYACPGCGLRATDPQGHNACRTAA